MTNYLQVFSEETIEDLRNCLAKILKREMYIEIARKKLKTTMFNSIEAFVLLDTHNVGYLYKQSVL